MQHHFRNGLGWLLSAWVVLEVGAASEPPRPHSLERVVVVFKTHFDIGYTDMASNIVQRYRTTMIDQALEVVDRNRHLPADRQFVWTVSGWPMHKILEDWPGQTKERKRRVLEAFRGGRFAVHALPCTTHTELLEPEDLVRGLSFSSRLSRATGLPLPRDAKMTDVPAHSWIVPTLLKHAGVDFLHLGCNAASSSPEVPLLFWWEGPDGSRLLTMYSAAGYGTGLTPPRDWAHRTWLALIHTGDNHGPPRPEEIQTLLAEAQAKLPGVKIQIGRLSDFADALLAEDPQLPVIRGDMPDTWIHGPMSDPAGARRARNVRPRLVAAESLDTLLRVWGTDLPSAADTIAQAYEQSLLYGEHTWGGAFWWINSEYDLNYGTAWEQDRERGLFQRIESSWAEHSEYIEKADDLAQSLLTDRLARLARSVNRSGKRAVVYNPLPWPRTGLVRFPDTGPPRLTARAEDDTQPSTAWLDEGVRTFLARDIPAMGYRTYSLSPSDEPNRASSPLRAAELRSPSFIVRLDADRGVIRSVIDRDSGREWVDAKAEQGFGQFLYERFSRREVQAFVDSYVKIDTAWATNELGKPDLPPASEAPYRALSPEGWSLRIENRPGRQCAVMKADATDRLPAVTTKIVLHRDLPFLDLEVTLHDKPMDPWPEAGWLCLPFRIASPQFRLGRLGGIVDPTKDIVRGSNHHLFGVNTGVAVLDAQGAGVGVCSLDSPLISLAEPGCWKYSRAYTPDRAAIYVNLFNNQWTTNFRLWNGGTWTYRVRLWSIAAYESAKDLIAPSLEARYPLLAAVADGRAGPRPASRTGVGLSRDGILVTAFRPAPTEDGAGILLRLWEHAGQSGDCRVDLPEGLDVSSVQPLDLRGAPTGGLAPVHGTSFNVALGAYAPATYLLRP